MGRGKRRAVFLDRDGTIIEDVGYLRQPEDIRLLGGVSDPLRLLKEHGFLLVLATNQSGVARGLLERTDVDRIHDRLNELLGRALVTLDAIYVCPHHPQDGRAPYLMHCTCRKPEPGMLLQAQRDLDIDLSASWLIGDQQVDIECGRRAGCQTILVLTGREPGPSNQGTVSGPDAVVPDLLGAAQHIIAMEADPRSTT